MIDQLNPDAAAKLYAIHPLLGISASAIFLIATLFTIVNSFRTKKNTEANKETASLLNKHKEEMTALKDEAVTAVRDSVHEFQETVTFTKNQLLEEMRNVKIGVMKVNESTSLKLSQIPKIQDALTRIEKDVLDEKMKASFRDEKWEQAIDFFNKAKKKI